MDNEKLNEIKNEISILPTLEKRMEGLQNSIYDSEAEVHNLLVKYEEESLDVEKLKDEKFSTMVLRFLGRYDTKLDKETDEMLAAKMEYDKAVERVKELKLSREELGIRISELRNEKRLYEDELRIREENIRNKTSSEVYSKYMELEEERELNIKQLVETEEALRAAIKAISIGKNASIHLQSAENWATYDVWFKSGIISHIAKYDHIDSAESDFNKLHSQLKELKRELMDVKMFDAPEISTISSTTRTIDFRFDNIFTDLKVRGKIRNDREQLDRILSSVNKIISRLESNKRNVESKLKSIDHDKNDLIMNL